MENQTLALIASFIAMAFVVIAYFVKKKAYYLLCELLCVVFLVISYFFTVQFFAMIGLVVGLFRTVTFFVYENKDKQAPIGWSFLFSGLTIAFYFIVNFGILKTAQPLDALCVLALVAYAFIFRIRNLKIVRFTMIIPTVLSILFNVLTRAAIFATLTYVFELCANAVSIFKYHIFGKGRIDIKKILPSRSKYEHFK
ncbi:MAG: YgjV family protein [Clostridia bacterium]|nr:YgjV family protein [Clostridia bacterium]